LIHEQGSIGAVCCFIGGGWRVGRAAEQVVIEGVVCTGLRLNDWNDGQIFTAELRPIGDLAAIDLFRIFF